MSILKIPVPTSVNVPPEAYKYFPEPTYQVSGTGKKLLRHIFEHQKLTDFENEKLQRLEAHIKNGKIEGFSIPSDWSRNHLLRFCYGTSWKTRNAVKVLVSYLKWRQEKMQLGSEVLYPKVLGLLVKNYLELRSILYPRPRPSFLSIDRYEFFENRL